MTYAAYKWYSQERELLGYLDGQDHNISLYAAYELVLRCYYAISFDFEQTEDAKHGHFIRVLFVYQIIQK